MMVRSLVKIFSNIEDTAEACEQGRSAASVLGGGVRERFWGAGDEEA